MDVLPPRFCSDVSSEGGGVGGGGEGGGKGEKGGRRGGGGGGRGGGGAAADRGSSLPFHHCHHVRPASYKCRENSLTVALVVQKPIQ